VSHELPLEEAPGAYHAFDRHLDGFTKIVLKPDAGWSPRHGQGEVVPRPSRS
jgi:hypothetical protein